MWVECKIPPNQSRAWTSLRLFVSDGLGAARGFLGDETYRRFFQHTADGPCIVRVSRLYTRPWNSAIAQVTM